MYSTDFGTMIFDDVRQKLKASCAMFFNFLLNSITSSELSVKALQPIVCKFSGHLNFVIFALRKASEQISDRQCRHCHRLRLRKEPHGAIPS